MNGIICGDWLMTTLRFFSMAAFVGLGALATAPDAGAGSWSGPCGGAYAVDAPTTLSRVARACNVSLGALREANPGVDPGDVRPGQHLSVPPVRPSGAAAPIAAGPAPQGGAAGSGSGAPASSHPYIVSPEYAAVTGTGNGAKVSSPLGPQFGPQWRDNDATIRVRDARIAEDAPLWLSARAPQDTPRGGHYAETSRLSFQKQSAVRIRNAGFMQASAAVPSPDGVPAARFTDKPAIVKAPEQHGDGYRLPDYSMIGKLPSNSAAQKISFALSGHVEAVEGGCLLLQSEDNVTWRLAMPSSADNLVGKIVTAWGVRGAGASCGDGPSMLVSHTVYAEPWRRGE